MSQNVHANSTFKKVLAAMLASLMIAGTFTALPAAYSAPSVSAAQTVAAAASPADVTITKDMYDDITYAYVQKNTDVTGKVTSVTAFNLKFEPIGITTNYKLTSFENVNAQVEKATEDLTDEEKAALAKDPTKKFYYENTAATYVAIPATLECDEVTYDVTEIGSVFADSTVTTANIPDSITAIESLGSVTTIEGASIGTSAAWNYAKSNKDITFVSSFDGFAATEKLSPVLEPKGAYTYASEFSAPVFAYEYTTADGTYRIITDAAQSDDGKGTITIGSAEAATEVKVTKVRAKGADGAWTDTDEAVAAKLSLSGTAKAEYTMVSGDISKATVTCDATAAYNNGAAVEANNIKVILGEGDDTIELSKDFYDIKYYNNTAVGEATFTVTGKESDTKKVYGSKTGNTFKITEKVIEESNVECDAEYVFTGAAITPVKVKSPFDGYLTEGVDYEVTYAKNINCGRATATITGKGNYATEKPIVVSFDITPKTITKVTTTESEMTSDVAYVEVKPQTFTGAKVKPAAEDVKVYVKAGEEKVLLDASNYSISYGAEGSGINAGKNGLVYIEFKGNCKLTDEPETNANRAMFEITPANFGDLKVEAKDVVYGAAPDITVTLNGVDITAAVFRNETKSNYVVKYDTATGAELGEHTATVSIGTGGNFKVGGDKVESFTVNYAVTAGVISAKSTTVTGLRAQTYDGTAKTPAPTVKIGGTTLRKDRDYTVTYENNVNAGTAKVTITGIGNFTGSVTKSFEINPIKVTSANYTAVDTVTYTGTFVEPNVTVKAASNGKALIKGVDYDLTYGNNVKAGANAYVIVKFKGNYTGAIVKNFTIRKVNLADEKVFATVSVPEQSFRLGKDITPEVKLGDVTLAEGSDYEVIYDEHYQELGEHTYTVVFNTNNFATAVTPTEGDPYTVTAEFKYTVFELDEMAITPKVYETNNVDGKYVSTGVETSSILAGDVVALSSVVTGGTEDYTYTYAAKHSTDSSWTTFAKNSDSDTFAWRPRKAGTYTVRVRATDNEGNTAVQNIKLYVKLNNTSDITYRGGAALATETITVDGEQVTAYTINKGETVRLAGSAVGNQGSTTYRFAAQNEADEKGTELYKGSRSYKDWTPRKTGLYSVWVRVTDGNGCTSVVGYYLNVK